MKKYTPFTITSSICLLLFLIDRVSKYYALYYCIPRCRITSFLAFDLAFNRGISWGMLHTQASGPFYAVTTLIIAVTAGISWYAYQRAQLGYYIWGELLIITGSISNIIDRFMHTGVIDFIELSWGAWTWPLFNCADTYIVLGVILMFIPLLSES